MMHHPLKYSTLMAIPVALFFAGPATADTLRVGETQYDDVYVLESDSLFYVSLPDVGRVLSIRKDSGQRIELTLSKDEERRQLYQKWKANREPDTASFLPKVGADDRPADLRPLVRGARVKQGLYERVTEYSDDDVPILRLKGEPRPKDPNLQASIRNNIARMRGSLTKDSKYPLRGRPFGPAPGRAFGRGGGGGFGGGGFGGGAGGGGFGGGARGGGAGGGGVGGGGAGGGAGGGFGGGGGAMFSNISQLFGTIDDASVGESPATITLQNGFR